ncbi:MAG: cation diffusion facilitator family transporter [Synergistetes bacterium]|nr:cation diffusion facilitator family transporter [Synergistota bacterium]MCX8127895.1 cation diffusion facilitator family transporter [Synergistota bacterium]MDW8192157.1 cation diffusion facilitator family transporter [Synergistota bacterium]
MGLNQWLLNKLLSKEKQERKSIGYLEGWISIIGNTILFLFKLIAGMYLNSISLIADAFHSLSDVLTSGIVILGFKLGDKPADEKHPFGHGRIEQISAIFIAFILIIVAYDLGKSSLNRILHPQKTEFNTYVLLILILAAIFKEWMARFSTYLGKEINSTALIADAWHHRSDAIATLLVAIGLIMAKLSFLKIDGIIGLIVSILIGWIGIDIVKSSSSFLIGETPDKKLLELVKIATSSTPGVIDYHDVSVHDYSSNKVITLHIEVDRNITIKEAHDIALKIQRIIQNGIKEAKVIIHIDPLGEKED